MPGCDKRNNYITFSMAYAKILTKTGVTLRIVPKFAKDTAGSARVKPLAGLAPPVLWLSLASTLKIRIKRAIRGSQPGAERTVSAISPYRVFHRIGDIDVAGPVGPSSRASAF